MTHEGSVSSVAFSPNGKYVLSVSADGTARVWIWQPNDLIAKACAALHRNLTRAEWKRYIGDALRYQAVCPNLPIEPEVVPTASPTP
jgi:WD40 repeat protein